MAGVLPYPSTKLRIALFQQIPTLIVALSKVACIPETVIIE
jgi:hypothetical protein